MGAGSPSQKPLFLRDYEDPIESDKQQTKKSQNFRMSSAIFSVSIRFSSLNGVRIRLNPVKNLFYTDEENLQGFVSGYRKRGLTKPTICDIIIISQRFFVERE